MTSAAASGTFTGAKHRLKASIAITAPWKVMFDLHSLTLPLNFHEAITRIKTNIPYFRTNYALILLIILFLSLLWRPISLMVFTALFAVWLFLYFLRDEPFRLFGRAIDDRVVLVALMMLTTVFLILTKAAINILLSILIGVVVVLIHAVMRKTDDLFLDLGSAVVFTFGSDAPGSSSS